MPEMIDSPQRLDNLSPQQKRALLAELLREELDASSVTLPLTYMQQAMWYLYRFAPESSAYNVAFTVRVRSNIDVPAMQRAIQQLVDRHEPLRTTFGVRDGKPVQMIHRRTSAQLEEIDCTGCDDTTLYQRVVDAYHRPFSLEDGPILRACLFTRASDDHVLLLAAHHIAVDGWSVWVILDELCRLYGREIGVDDHALSPLPARFSDYVRWQIEALDGPGGERLWAYWQAQLQGELPILDLPLDRPRPPVQTFNGSTLGFEIGSDLSAAVKEFAREQQTTAYTVLLTAFQVLLHRYTGQDDVLVGSPMAGRSRPEFAPLAGNFINMVVLRGDLSGTPSFQSLITRTKSTVLDALEHQDFPFPLLVDRLNLRPDASRSPLFQVAFDLQRIQRVGELTDLVVARDPDARVELGGLVFESYPMPQQEGQLDLTLQMLEAGDLLFGAIKYNTDLFETQSIERLVSHFRTLLGELIAQPGRAVANAPMLTEPERHQLLVEWNDTEVEDPTDPCLHELFEEQAGRTPDSIAVTFEQSSLTYRELDTWADGVAARLHELGVGPGTLVGVFMDRSLELVAGLLGVLKAGGAYVPLDPAYPRDRLAFMLEDSRTPVLVTHSMLAGQLPVTNQQVVLLDTETGLRSGALGRAPGVEVTPDDPAYAIYTSGSTGQPNGVVIQHRAIVNHMRWFIEQFGFDASSVMLQKTPYSFDPSVHEFYAPLLVGGRLVMARPGGHANPAYLVETIRDEGVTAIHLVPMVLSALVDHPEFGDCRSLRHVFCGGDVLSRDLQDRFFTVQEARLHNLYGPAEATIDASFWTCQRDSDEPVIPIGRPVRNMKTYVLDSTLQPVPVGVVGDLYLGGVGLAVGYLHRPELTADRFIPNPFSSIPGDRIYRTGDLARYRVDGALLYAGRRDHQLKLRGFRVELGEIEATLRQHPAIEDAVVVARQDQRGDRKLAAYLITGDDGKPSPADLRGHLKAILPSYMVPAAFVFLDTFPLTPSGKVDRRALPDPMQHRMETDERFAAPRTATEEIVARIWRKALGIDRVGVYDNFFDLGGHSLQLVEVLAAFEQELGVKVNPALTQTGTLGQLAALCDEMISRGEVVKPEPVASGKASVIGAMRRMLDRGIRKDA